MREPIFLFIAVYSYSHSSLSASRFHSGSSLTSSPDWCLPESGKPSALDLAQSTAAADECDGSDHCDSREDLEQSPGSIVQEEDALDGEKGAKEHDVRNRSRLQGGRQVVDVDTEEEPLEQCQ